MYEILVLWSRLFRSALFWTERVMFGVEPEVFRCKTPFNNFVKKQFICQIVLSKQKTNHRSIDLRSKKTIGRYFKMQFTPLHGVKKIPFLKTPKPATNFCWNFLIRTWITSLTVIRFSCSLPRSQGSSWSKQHMALETWDWNEWRLLE